MASIQDTIRNMTMGEVAKVEQLTGLGLEALTAEGAPRGNFLASLVFVQSRRQGAALTWDDCLAMTATEVGEYLDLADTTDDDQDDDGVPLEDESPTGPAPAAG